MKTRRWMLAAGFYSLSGVGLACARNSDTSEILRMSAPRAAHAVAVLADGSVLFIGGCVRDGCEIGPASATIDRYDPASNKVSSFGTLMSPHIDGAAALSSDGKVIVAGGWAGQERTPLVECFDPVTRVSSRIGEMSAAQVCRAIALKDGRVLLVGERTVDFIDPETRRVSQLVANSPYLDGGTATLLENGRVLIAGGGLREPRSDAFLLDPQSGEVARTGGLAKVRRKHAAVRLLDGRVLIIGGSDERDRNGGKMKALELYDPATGRFSIVGMMHEARYKIVDAALRLVDGRILVVGGAEKPEIIDPSTWISKIVDIEIGEPFNFATAAALSNGDVIVAGGYGESTITPTNRVWIIRRSALA